MDSIASVRSAQLQREQVSNVQRASLARADAAVTSDKAVKAQLARDTRVANETVRTVRTETAKADESALQAQKTEASRSERTAIEASKSLRNSQPVERPSTSSSSRPVTNAQGQRTGRVINTTA